MGCDSNVNQVSLEALFIPSPFLTSVYRRISLDRNNKIIEIQLLLKLLISHNLLLRYMVIVKQWQCLVVETNWPHISCMLSK